MVETSGNSNQKHRRRNVGTDWIPWAPPEEAIPARSPVMGGERIAPPISTSPGREDVGYTSKSKVLPYRPTEEQFDQLSRLRYYSGYTVQAHLRRAVHDYLTRLVEEHPEYFEEHHGST